MRHSPPGLATSVARWPTTIDLGHLDAARRAVVDAIAGLHLQALGGDPGKSLAVLSIGPSICEMLVRAGGPEVEATLEHVGSGHGSTNNDDDPERTGGYSLGSATSLGQRFQILRPHARAAWGRSGKIQQSKGQIADAIASFRSAIAVMERLPIIDIEYVYDRACYHALFAGAAGAPGSGLPATEGRQSADRAMDNLRRAVAAGYRNVGLMQTDTDLDPLRDRADFRALMMDLVFPTKPFAQ